MMYHHYTTDRGSFLYLLVNFKKAGHYLIVLFALFAFRAYAHATISVTRGNATGQRVGYGGNLLNLTNAGTKQTYKCQEFITANHY